MHEHLEDVAWFYAASLLYLKRMGVNVAIHTDSVGARLLDGLPYDDVRLTLDAIPSDFPECFWAASKFFALKEEPLGSVHIDGDVFIKTEECLERMQTRCDLIVQCSEALYCIDHAYLAPRRLLERAGFGRLKYPSAFNCGVVGINNQRLKDMYLNAYFTAVGKVQELIATEGDKLTAADLNIIPDLVAEQQLLYNLVKTGGFSYATVLAGASWEDHKKNATDIGFLHIITRRKFERTDDVKRIVKRLDADAYRRIERNIELYNQEKTIEK